MSFTFAARCPLPNRITFSGWSAPPGVIAVARADVMDSSRSGVWKKVK